MKKLLLIAALMFTLSVSNAQTKSKAELVADETTIQVNKSSIKMVTCNEEIMQRMLKQYKTNFKKYTVEFKRDRAGEYNQYTILFELDKLPELREYLTNL